MWAILCHNSLFYFNCENFDGVFFFTKFQVETTVMVRSVKITTHSSTYVFPSDFQIKSSRLTTLKQFSLSLVPLALPWKLMLSVSSTFASVQPPAHSKVYLEKLISLSFLILGNDKATLYPKTNLMLMKQKPLLK